ncbi:MAG: hypothetical protein ACREIA_01525 [Opitutaceae bacterium]
MNSFLKISLIILAVLVLAALCGGWGAIPFILVGGVVALGVSALFTVVSTVLGILFALAGLVVGLVCLVVFAPIVVPLLILALPLLIVFGVIGALFPLCAG